MHQHYLMFQNDPPLSNQSPIWKGPAPQMTKRDNSAFWIQQRTLNAILSKEFHWTGKQYMWRNEAFFNKTFLIRHSYKPLSSSPHSSTYRVAKSFLKKSVQKSVHLQKKSVQFSKKNPYNPYNLRKKPYNPYIFFKNPYNFRKNQYNQYNFRKKSLQSVHFRKIKPFLKILFHLKSIYLCNLKSKPN